MLALLAYLLFGLCVAWRALPSQRGVVKCWLGLVFGCVALMWLPCLPAFFVGFTMTAQRIALGLCFAGTAAAVLIHPWKKSPQQDIKRRFSPPGSQDLAGLLLSLFATVFCVYLLHTHIILPHEDGSLWVGQSTYGDLTLHLSFIESFYQQGQFPPEYSIFPGQKLDYPFLADAASGTLRFFGLSLRMAVIVPSVVMLFCVFLGFWLLAAHMAKKTAPTLAAWLLFVCNGGFGFILFLTGKYSFSDLLTGFYVTPTNLIGEDIRWVNVVCDMLIPQRTTMAGWCVGIPALYLLITALEKTVDGQGGRREFLVLAVLAGFMPMIHTHTFLSLGMLSAGWFFAFLPKVRRQGRLRALIENYILYGLVCMLLALPQLMEWAFDAAGSGRYLWFNPGWEHGHTNWLLFWLLNGGIVFVLMIPMMLFLRGDRARLFWGAAPLFIVANLIAFQPNPYDNNKLMYIWYMLTDILVCVWFWEQLERLRPRALAPAAAVAVVILGTLSGLLTMLREAVGEYQLLDANQAAAAQFIVDDTDPHGLFLTGTNHNNPVSILTGRDILCGSDTFLYYHGIDYLDRQSHVAEMYAGGQAFEQYAAQYGVDYVFIGSAERNDYQVDMDYFRENYPCIYDQNGITIFQITQ